MTPPDILISQLYTLIPLLIQLPRPSPMRVHRPVLVVDVLIPFSLLGSVILHTLVSHSLITSQSRVTDVLLLRPLPVAALLLLLLLLAAVRLALRCRVVEHDLWRHGDGSALAAG